jgi:hypothetical protein
MAHAIVRFMPSPLWHAAQCTEDFMELEAIPAYDAPPLEDRLADPIRFSG